MAKPKKAYGIPFKVHEEDPETLAAIDRGLRDAEEGRVIPAEDVRKLMDQWIAEWSARKRAKRNSPTV